MTDCPLSDRQLQIVEHLAEGRTDTETGRVLCLTVNTVKSHLRRAYAATGTRNAVALVALALRSGWIR